MIDSVTSALGGALHEVDLAVNETFKSQTDLRDRLENIQVSRKHFLLKIKKQRASFLVTRRHSTASSRSIELQISSTSLLR